MSARAVWSVRFEVAGVLGARPVCNAVMAALVAAVFLAPGAASAGELEDAARATYSRCMVLSFEGSAEGSSEQPEYEELGEALIPLLTELPDHACSGLIDATACAQWLGETSCDGLANALLPAVTEEVQLLSDEFVHLSTDESVPLWASAVSDAMVAWVSRCYAVEAGVPVNEQERDALGQWARVLAQALVEMTRGQQVDSQLAAACSGEIDGWDCDFAGGTQLSELPLQAEDSACGELLTFDETFGE